ncbi:MAG: hypothetical protein K2P48_11990 [Lachnospiraceae bacterium]|nr:hypothetical protein [Lachnospiraceae bacterium]
MTGFGYTIDLVEKQHKYGCRIVEKQQHLRNTEKQQTEYFVSDMKLYGYKYEIWYCALLIYSRRLPLTRSYMPLLMEGRDRHNICPCRRLGMGRFRDRKTAGGTVAVIDFVSQKIIINTGVKKNTVM